MTHVRHRADLQHQDISSCSGLTPLHSTSHHCKSDLQVSPMQRRVWFMGIKCQYVTIVPGRKIKKIPLWKKNFPRNCLKQVKYHPQKGTYLLEYKPMVWLDRDLWSSDWQVRGHLTISAVFTFFWSFHNSVIT